MNITESAKLYIENMMKEKGIANLRFTFEGSGCCGPNYGITLSESQEGDVQEIVNEITVSIDERVVDIVEDITVDFKGTGEDGGLIVRDDNGCC